MAFPLRLVAMLLLTRIVSVRHHRCGAIRCNARGSWRPFGQGYYCLPHKISELPIRACALRVLCNCAQIGNRHHAPDADLDRSAPRNQATLTQDLEGSAEMNRQHVASGVQGKISCAALELVNRAVR